jgi:hypothetical protein
MRCSLSACALILCVLAIPAAAQPVDASGTWTVTFNTPAGQNVATMTLTKTGEALAGTLSSEMGQVGIEGTQKEKTLTLGFTIETGNGPLYIAMTGVQDGDSMAGGVDFGGMGQSDWYASRAGSAPAAPAAGGAADVSGAWALEVTTEAGSGTPTVTLKQDGGQLSGQYSGQFGEAPVSGTITGQEITFGVEMSVQGTPVKIAYTGKVDGATMSGTVSFGDLGGGTFTGKRK